MSGDVGSMIFNHLLENVICLKTFYKNGLFLSVSPIKEGNSLNLTSKVKI